MKPNTVAEKNTYSKSNHIEIKKKISFIKSLFKNAGININPQSNLYQLLDEVYDSMTEQNTEALMIKSLYVDRLAIAMECLNDVDNKEKYLKDLLNGSLDVLAHKPSRAKSILFELETLTKLQSFIKESYLDEPDVVIPIGEYEVGVSCKKVTSEKNFQKILSNAVKQIKSNSFKYGIVAINIDDLHQENALLTPNTIEGANDYLFNHNMKFIDKHERYFQKYIKTSKILAVLVHSSVFVDIKTNKPRFNTASQTTVWTVKNLREDQQKVLDSLKKAIQ